MALDAPNQNSTWSMHDLCGLPHEVSLKVLGTVGEETLREIQKIPLETGDVGWPDELSAVDLELAAEYGFDAVKANDIEHGGTFVEFGRPEVAPPFIKAIEAVAPGISGREVDTQAFKSYFAHLHSDDAEECRAQLNIIVENKAGHRLFSLDEEGNRHVLAPKAGDIVFLDTRCRHAVLPDQSEGVEHMRQNPMQAVFVILPILYD